jgi:hypothetical protein
MTNTIDNSDKIIDSRDVEERIEELRDMLTPRYVAGWNMPGYLPDSEPAEFDDADDAMEYLKEAAKQIIASTFDDEMETLTEEIEAWKADKQGEFGITFVEHHYWIVQDGEMGLDEEEKEELEKLESLRDEAKPYCPDWHHGATLIHEDHFAEYCEELVQDIGDLPRKIPDYLVIDWEATAENLRVDYTAVDFDGETYYVC